VEYILGEFIPVHTTAHSSLGGHLSAEIVS